VDTEQVNGWVRAYRRAWESNDPAEIGALYADGATDHMRPYLPAVTGRDAIVADWLARKDEPGAAKFRYEILAACNDVGFVRCWTTYVGPPVVEYHNLWVLRLDGAGRATEFVEWWMKRESFEGDE
jgi:hypothetical protein